MVSSAVQLLHASQCFQLLTPLVHASAIYWTWPSQDHRKNRPAYAITFPVAGGPRTFVFQVLSWTHFAVSLLLAIPPWYTPGSPHLELFMTLACFSAVVSLLFMFKSILLFDPSDDALRRGHLWRRLARSRDAIEWDVSRLPSRHSAFYIVVCLGLLWSVLGAGLLAAAHGHENPTLRVTYHAFAAACFTVAAFTTHGLGGHLRHRLPPKDSNQGQKSNAPLHANGPRSRTPNHPHHHRSKSSAGPVRAHKSPNASWDELRPTTPVHRLTQSELPQKISEDLFEGLDLQDQIIQGQGVEPDLVSQIAHWRFFQPFRGGTVFVATQAAGWLLYSAALTIVLWGTGATALGLAHSLKSWAVAAGATGVAAEVAIAISLLAYNARDGVVPIPFYLPKAADVQSAASYAAIVVLLYLQVHVVVASIVLSFAALPPLHTAALWVGGLGVYFSATGMGAEHTGRREWTAFRDWVGKESQRVLPCLIGSFEVRGTDGAKFKSGRKYVFGYAPHGLFPIGAAYLPCTPAFKKVVGHAVDPVTLTASVVFQLPFLRDLLLWMGARAVSRATFIRALRDRGAVIMVPGGQAELVEAYRAASRKKPELVVCTRHRGFARLAAQEGAALVPVVVFGEVTSLRNAITMPKLQRATYKIFGFPVPFLMAGKAGVLPLPSKTGIRFVVGRPIEPPPVSEDGHVEEAAVDALHAEFYKEVGRLWEENKKDFPSYENMPLVHA